MWEDVAVMATIGDAQQLHPSWYAIEAQPPGDYAYKSFAINS
jgi:hypothetical protein